MRMGVRLFLQYGNPMLWLPLTLAAWELAWWKRRKNERVRVYNQALQQALALGRPLVVIGAPDGGVTAGYGCGDLTIDLQGSASCPRVLPADITKTLPLPSDSVVVFVSCVLEYVNDAQAAMNELMRISGGHLFIVRVEPWTLTAYLYPGAKRTLPASIIAH